MKPSYDVTGSQVTGIKEYDIDAATAVSIGQVVKLSAGKVVLAAVGETSPILGTAVESHPGTADTLNTRSNGTRIKVYDSPTQVFEGVAPQVTATNGTTTTLVAGAIAGVFADSDFVGGKMKLISKAVASTNTDPLGTVYPITGSTAVSGTFTTTQAAGGAITAGDVFAIFPPVGFQKGNLDAGISKLVLTATAALPIRVSSFDTDKNVIFHDAALHEHGNKKA